MSRLTPLSLPNYVPPIVRDLLADDSSFQSATSREGHEVGQVLVMAASKEVVVAAQVPGWALARDIPSAAIGLGPAGAAPAAFTRVRIIYNGKVGGREEWELDEEVRYTDPTLACTLIATKGYKFDLASVPRPLWSLIAPFQLSILAPLFHDLIYDRKGVMKEGDVIPFPRRPDFTQRDADDLFYRLMEAEGVDYWRRQLAYFAVRAAGWTYWNT